MRHRIHLKKLNRTSEHRKALRRNLSQSLIEHGSITTTLPKAKDVRPFVEGLITLAVKTRKLSSSDPAASLRARRRIHRMLSDRGLIPAEHKAAYAEMSDAARHKTMRMVSGRRYRTGEPRGRLAFTAESVIHRLIEHVAREFEERPGGYTRLIRLPKKRKGDDASLAMVQLVGGEEIPTSLTKPKKTARRRRADARYGVAVKAAKERAKAQKAAGAKAKPDQDAAAEADQEAPSAEQHTNE